MLTITDKSTGRTYGEGAASLSGQHRGSRDARSASRKDGLTITDAATGTIYGGAEPPFAKGGWREAPGGSGYDPTEAQDPPAPSAAPRRDNHDVYHAVKTDPFTHSNGKFDTGLSHASGSFENKALDEQRRKTNRAFRTADAFLPQDPGVYLNSPEQYDTYTALYDAAAEEEAKLHALGGRSARELPLTLPKSFAAGGLGAVRGIVNEAGYLAQNAAKAQMDENAELWRRAGREDYARDMEKTRDALNPDGLQSWADFGEDFIRGTAAEAAGYGKAGRALNHAASGMGGMAPAILTNLAVPGSGLWVTAAQAAGNATEEALSKGASDDAATLYGAAVGGIEALTEKISGGIPALGVGAIDDAAETLIRGSLRDPIAQNAAIRLVKSLGEGAEEFVSEFADAYIYKQLTGSTDRSWKQVSRDAWYSALIGTLTSAGLNLSADALNAMSPRSLAKTLAADTAVRMAEEGIDGMRTIKQAETGENRPDIDRFEISVEKNEMEPIQFVAASPRFVNSHDELLSYSKEIKPIEGYLDVVVHGDTSGFFFQSTDGKWSNVDYRQFAAILKNSELFHGENIRLISCEAGKEGSFTAQGLANALGVSVMAPTDTVYVFKDGRMIVSSDGLTDDGKWIIISPQNMGR